MNDLSKFWSAVENAKTIAIGGHIRPDGDCVGSVMGLYNYLKEYYNDKQITVYLGEYSKEFCFLNGMDSVVNCTSIEQVKSAIAKAPEYDLFIALDTGSTERLEFHEIFKKAENTVCLDHHITNEKYANENFVYDTSSSAEALYDVISFRENKAFPEVSREVAECIYLGIIHDTGVFKHSNTTRHTMEVAGVMLECGVNNSKIIDETFYKKTYKQNLIFGRVLEESTLLADGRVIAGAVFNEYFEFYEASKPDLEGIVDQLRITEGVEVAIFAYEPSEGSFKYSLRSNSFVDVSKIALEFGGGGHIRAAGCTIDAPFKEGVKKIMAEIEKQFSVGDE